MAPAPSSSHAASQDLELANMTDVSIVRAGHPAQQFTVHTSLLIQSSKWFQERVQTLNSAGEAVLYPSSENVTPSTIEIPLPHTPDAVSIFVQYLYQKDVIPHTTTFTKHCIEAYHLSRFLESTDFTRCCERAIEHALLRGTFKPSLFHLQGLLECDPSNPIRTQILNNVVHRIARSEYEYNGDEDLVDGLTWKAICLEVAKKTRESKHIAAVDESDNRDGYHNIAKNGTSKNITTGGLFGLPGHNNQPQPQPSGGLFGSSQAQQCPSGSPFGATPPNNVTSHESFQGAAHTGSLFGRTAHNPPGTSGGLFGGSQAQPNRPGGLFGNSQPKITTGGLFGNTKQDQPQSSSGLFGNPSNNTTNAHGLFGSRPAQSGITSGLFGSKPNNAVPGGLFGNNNQPQPQTSGCFFGSSCTNNANRNSSNNGGFFGQSQGQNRLFDGFGNCKPSVSVFGQPNPPNILGSNVHVGGFGVPNTTCTDTYKPTLAQGAFNNSPFGGFGSRSTESGFRTDHSVHRSDNTTMPYTPFVEKEANGNTNVYNHISFISPFENISNEELRLTDYNNGFQFGTARPQWLQTGQSQGIFGNLPLQQAGIPLRKLNPAAELEQLSRKVASQQVELEALRTRIDQSEKSNSKANEGRPSEKPMNPVPKRIPWYEGAENCLTGLDLVFTGTLQSLGRDDAISLVEHYGATTTRNPCRKTSYVVLGDDAGLKRLEVIRSLGILTIDEDRLFQLIRCLPANGGNDEATGTETVSKGKQTIEEMTTLMCIFEKKLSLVENETETLKKRQEAYEMLLATGRTASSESIINNNGEVNSEKEDSATSTPTNILTPTSTATASPSPTFKPASITIDTDDFIDIVSSTKSEMPTNTFRLDDAAPASLVTPKLDTNTSDVTDPARDYALKISPTARLVLTYLKDAYSSSLSSLRMNDRKLRAQLDLQNHEVYDAAEELERKGFLHFDRDAACYRWGRKLNTGVLKRLLAAQEHVNLGEQGNYA